MKAKKRSTNVANVVPSVKKPKKSGKNAAQRQLDADWQAMLASHAAPLERGGIRTKEQKRPVPIHPSLQTVPKLTTPPGRTTTHHLKSYGDPGGVAVKSKDKVYTGTKMLGVATMHKSNAVPVFNDQHLVEISSMRRNEYEREVKKKPIDE